MQTTGPAIRPDAADYLTRCQAADDLRAIREQWGDLLAAIERPPAAEWPPRETRGFLDQVADSNPAQPALGRPPLTLREHPAPLNLDALDAACEVERDLFELADRIAEQAQRPVRRKLWPGQGNRTPAAVDVDDRDDPARWHYAAPTSPGSRAYGLHWAAVWIEGRVIGEDTEGDLFRPLSPRLLDEAATTARRARAQVERALNRDGRSVTLTQPCPWCSGTLTGQTHPGREPAVTCSTGEACGAPVVLDNRRRTWRGADLVGLWVAMQAKH
ncbi:hypothetical protein [Streptomyces griseosporeus]|uniref:hypothetical protein n=1 Tax=Streptomyces griseosporeus TaxID=1910 RepID=UPI0036F5A2BD